MSLIPLPYKLLAIVLLLASLAVAYLGWHHHVLQQGVVIGEAKTQAKWDADNIARAKAQAKAISAATIAKDAEEKHDKDATKTVEVTYETRKTKVHNDVRTERDAVAAVGLRYDTTIHCDRPAESGQTASAGLDHATGTETVELPLKITESLLDLASDADEQVALKDAKIQALQDWIASHGFYTP